MEGKEREKLIVDIAVGLTERAKKCSTFSCLRYLKSSSWYTLVRLLYFLMSGPAALKLLP